MRIISICPSNTELLTYAGLIDQVVAVDDFSDWPDAVNQLPRLGPDLRIDMDKVEALQPDLVYASLSVPGMEKNIEKLAERGIPYTVVDNPKSLGQIGEVLKTICSEAGKRDRGIELQERFNQFLDHYRNLSKKVKEPKTVYWEWWPKPIFTPGATNWLSEMSELSGAVNVFASEDVSSVKTDWEAVIHKNPEVIFIAWVGVQKEKVNTKVVLKRSGAEKMEAVLKKELYILDEPFYCRPSPRLLIGLAEAAYILHPEIFPAPTRKEDEILYL
ncbi:cobalamin-binding protein [Alkalicoccus daliensis]|uniref:Iron complex transport system substrate-binding protein n=1 Tax=Alkalicoccus daliensis TaxID=745820 RepID=A0A1H0AJE4_9BACI|nr:cobalamin-binding protein [Alkalicoccus daliensis]SDN33599.1 iron complex transport system substrate-binding protein [Alkalicoccus daliensis]